MGHNPTVTELANWQITVRIAGLSTSDFIADAIGAALRRESFVPAISTAAFGTLVGELILPPSSTDVTIVVLDEPGMLGRDWRLSVEGAQAQFNTWVHMLLEAITHFSEARPSTCLVVNTVPQATFPHVGHLDATHPDGLSYRISEFNRHLRGLAARHNSVRIVDSDAALAHIAPSMRSDPKLWLYGRIPYSAVANAALAEAFATAVKERSRPPPKVLSLDLDDTLWRGIYGEAGALGVECGDDFPGNAFKAFQAECLRLKSQGILLTVLSKNDPDAFDVFHRHPGMLLQASDFVATRINWSPKADNIRDLADELNLGLDSFVFVDDSPHEREAMRQLAPAVRVLDLPADPALRIGALRSYSQLWPLRLTEEDTSRTQLYSVRLRAQKARAKTASIADYLESLQQRLVVRPVEEGGIPRIVQMHEKTNQFNLTTRRYSESDLRAMAGDPEHHLILQGSVSDRFGDHGVVICSVTSLSGSAARISSFLMSCRVIAREVEFAFLGALIERLIERGVMTITGEFIATSRNGPAANFLKAAGFNPVAGTERDGKLFEWRAVSTPRPGARAIEVVSGN